MYIKQKFTFDLYNIIYFLLRIKIVELYTLCFTMIEKLYFVDEM